VSELFNGALFVLAAISIIVMGGAALDMHIDPQRTRPVREIEARLESLIRPTAPMWVWLSCHVLVVNHKYPSQHQCLSAAWHEGLF
jgi:hypothetical protein